MRFLVYQKFLLHTEGEHRIRSGRHSSLPRSISAESTYLEKSEKNAKFSIGPAFESPGPILFIQVATAENVVAKSALFSETRIMEKINIPR